MTAGPFVHDFVPIEENFERAGSVLLRGGSTWVTGPATVALVASDATVDVGVARSNERGVVIPLRRSAGTGPFATLDADLRLEPMPPPRSHLSLSGSYEASSSEANGSDAATDQHLTESCVRRFLVGVAATLERGRAEFPPP